jgi:hypothetical protein
MALQHGTYNAGRLAYIPFGLLRVRSPLLVKLMHSLEFSRAVIDALDSPKVDYSTRPYSLALAKPISGIMIQTC